MSFFLLHIASELHFHASASCALFWFFLRDNFASNPFDLERAREMKGVRKQVSK